MDLESLWYLIFSAIEFLGLFILTLALFRLKIRIHYKELIFSSIICSLISFSLYTFELSHSFMGMVLIIFGVMLSFKFIFWIDLKQAVPVGIFGYIAFSVIQGLLFAVLSIDLAKIEPNTMLTYQLQCSTTILIASISFVIKKTNQGFGYLVEMVFKRTKTGYAITIFSAVLAIVVAFSFYLFALEQLILFFVLVLGLLIFFASAMTYFFIKRDAKLYKF